ncbi:MAG: WcbI family polysaccharide biosynthesis putative acetyltransferase [Ornithinimicrobium sp.]|uniref:WcbI family polysaccharide biosynthesis putative acetyltransferase n=1 Tax=Ornithinimicrobium sp. TaxID=1977084 RepID=UPI0026DFEE2F|nr:WcbI family polysaccharide biosynthesis putative acetyltransferase [Ornithinimicrobium sp.]MDO5738629.1 WcbI family polysaccharide biosynthesis putative acetyltransferase [Ornithinimicrobium sp.]
MTPHANHSEQEGPDAESSREDEGRRLHYGGFYGLEELSVDERPRLAVYGNCQAEALRVAIGTAEAVHSVRMPPVHELTEQDLPYLDRVLTWADVLFAQSVADGYRGLPLGTAQVAARMRPQARVLRAPNYFCTVLYPEQVLVRHDDPRVVDPPVVPYHDVRRLGRAAGWSGPDQAPAEAVRMAAQESLAELERRERDQGSLVISDAVRDAGSDAGWTVDHPGNPVLLALAQRVVDEVAHGATVHDPGRVLLASVQTPLRAQVLDALGLDGDPRRHWVVDGREIDDEEVGSAHREFYAGHPRVVEVGTSKKAEVLKRLGWHP